ncbi:MAG: hypothetical protein ACKVJK_19575 [Methylophagaceae bacterium]|jgi:hypothetical protein|tara:strand:+ start:425 stop:658 length:234 start_codon:yes stop_codon:yes gene_type:complete
MKELRDRLVYAMSAQYAAAIQKHSVNIEILLEKGVGVAEHPDLMATIDSEITLLAEAEDKLSTLQGHFERAPEPRVV